jgi:hypothetical protein
MKQMQRFIPVGLAPAAVWFEGRRRQPQLVLQELFYSDTSPSAANSQLACLSLCNNNSGHVEVNSLTYVAT